MARSLNIAATGMAAQQTNIEVIANNIANLNTSGFKRNRADFQDLLYQARGLDVGSRTSESGSVMPTGTQVGAGVKAGGIYRIHGQGALIGTENPLDLAISGRGYFVVNLPNGVTGYTRAGSLQLSQTGEIVSTDGHTIRPGLTVPSNAKQIIVTEQGLVQARIDGQIALVDVGRFEIVTFPNDAGLQSIGGNFYLATPASGNPTTGGAGDIGFGTLRQGFIEASNVDMVAEITALISAQRAYEMNSKVIQATDEMLRTTTQAMR
ncbi:MAG: flagellar basal-body rod protein FlgG [Alphaproteobacteria bacterium]|nr:flagellar basal-body rod protein FlgG [Alphaproteobacteria bacterium]